MIKVYQIISADHLKAMYPESSLMYGLGPFDPAKHIDKYEHVADLDVETLDEAFEVGNIGPEHRVKKYNRMHSISIGDILVNGPFASVVARFGFDELGAEVIERTR